MILGRLGRIVQPTMLVILNKAEVALARRPPVIALHWPLGSDGCILYTLQHTTRFGCQRAVEFVQGTARRIAWPAHTTHEHEDARARRHSGAADPRAEPRIRALPVSAHRRSRERASMARYSCRTPHDSGA